MHLPQLAEWPNASITGKRRCNVDSTQLKEFRLGLVAERLLLRDAHSNGHGPNPNSTPIIWVVHLQKMFLELLTPKRDFHS